MDRGANLILLTVVSQNSYIGMGYIGEKLFYETVSLASDLFCTIFQWYMTSINR